jgi:hypothetical protein
LPPVAAGGVEPPGKVLPGGDPTALPRYTKSPIQHQATGRHQSVAFPLEAAVLRVAHDDAIHLPERMFDFAVSNSE